MNNCRFHSMTGSHFPGCRRLMDQSGTRVKKTPSGLLTMISRRAYLD
jgi:hypothetical protein